MKLSKIGRIITLIILTSGCGAKSKDSGESSPAPTAPQKSGDSGTASKEETLLKTYCVSCHAGSSPSAGVALDSAAGLKANAEKGVSELEEGAMPPEGSKQPSSEEKTALKDWLKTKA